MMNGLSSKKACPKAASLQTAEQDTATGLLKWLPVFLAALMLLLSCPEEAGAKKQNKRVIRTGEMKNLFRQTVTSDLPWDKNNIKIRNFTTNHPDPAVARGELGHRIVSLVPERFLGRRYLTVIYTVDGRDQLKVKMSGDVHRYGNVLCAASRLSRGMTLEKDQIITKYRDITSLGRDLPHNPEEITGKVAKTTLRPGKIIYSHNLEKKKLVIRGEMVSIIAGSGPLKVSAPGEVEHNGGALGETVKVKNLMSRRIINARVIEEGMVRAGMLNY